MLPSPSLGEDFLEPVSNVVVTNVQAVTATIQWEVRSQKMLKCRLFLGCACSVRYTGGKVIMLRYHNYASGAHAQRSTVYVVCLCVCAQ